MNSVDTWTTLWGVLPAALSLARMIHGLHLPCCTRSACAPRPSQLPALNPSAQGQQRGTAPRSHVTSAC